MAQERTEAVLLRSVDYSNTSRILTFLSPDRGRLACIASGARRAKSSFGPLLDTFNRLELVYYWKDGRSVQKLTEASLLDTYSGVKADYVKNVYAAFPLELAYWLSNENEPSPELYQALTDGLAGWGSWSGDPAQYGAWHALKMLAAAGVRPAVDTCVHCGRTVPAGACGFSKEGGVVCVRCPSDSELIAAERDSLRAMADAPRQCPEANVAPVFALVCAYAAQQAGACLRSVRVIEQVMRI